jgi:hypothetical protein
MFSQIKLFIKKILGDTLYRTVTKAVWGVNSIWVRLGWQELSLGEIGAICKTDKIDVNHRFQGLTYLDIYEEYFRKLRRNNPAILEIGVKGGASLRTWKKYFKHANVFGLDIDPDCRKLEEPGIQIAIGSQDDVDFLGKCFGTAQKFDIIIDDGSHINRHIMTSFEKLFYERLNPGGIYIIEDLRCSYQALQTDTNIIDRWAGMKYNDLTQNYDNDREEMNKFFFDKIKELDYGKGEILSLTFWSMVCVITKTK